MSPFPKRSQQAQRVPGNEAVARAEILLNELPTARTLLTELEKDRSRQAQDVEKIFRLAIEHPEYKQMESWNVNPIAPDSSPLT